MEGPPRFRLLPGRLTPSDTTIARVLKERGQAVTPEAIADIREKFKTNQLSPADLTAFSQTPIGYAEYGDVPIISGKRPATGPLIGKTPEQLAVEMGEAAGPAPSEIRDMITRRIPSGIKTFLDTGAASTAELASIQKSIPQLKSQYLREVEGIARNLGTSFDPRSAYDPRFIPTIAATSTSLEGRGEVVTTPQRPAFLTFQDFLEKRRKEGQFQPPQQQAGVTATAIPFNRPLLRKTYNV